MLCTKISDTGPASHLKPYVAQFTTNISNTLVVCIKHMPFKMTAYKAKCRQVLITVMSTYRLMVTEVVVNL
jgi:hypothetical protein